MSRTYVLLNPASGSGAAARRWARLEHAAADVFADPTIVSSAAPGQLRAAAREIAETRRPVTILAAGGDGTSHEVINGIAEARSAGPVLMGWIPIGSGNDLARAAGVPLALDEVLPRYRRMTRTTIDIGRADYHDAAGAPVRLAFGNSLTLGLSVTVLELAGCSGKALGGRLGYLAATVRALMAPYRADWPLTINGQPVPAERLRLLAITNGQTVGAGMRIAPGAQLDDGRFECTRVANVSTVRALGILSSIYRGGHLGHPAVRQTPLTRLEIGGDGPIAFEADGELIRGFLPLTVTVEPRRLGIVRPAPRLSG